ncbi:MAG: hypothetical protein ABMB14_15110 [Myxococcota bacterium]
MRTFLSIVAGIVSATSLLGLVVWLAWPSVPTRLPHEPRRAQVASRASHPVEKRAPKPRPAAPVKRRPEIAAAPKKEPVLPPDDKAEARVELREERLESLNDRLDAFGDDAGWDGSTLEDVRTVLIDTSDHITTELARVDRGEADWDEVRRELRQYRLDQAAKVRRRIGDPAFDELVEGMDLERFLGEEPVRGRLP